MRSILLLIGLIVSSVSFAAAKLKGKYKGRPPKIDYQEIHRIRSQGFSIAKTAEMLGVSKSSVQRAGQM
jgi:DNA invertase Pin-like site-specific DNA recombinase